MENTLGLFLVIILAAVVYEDIKGRTIHVILPLVIFCLACVLNFVSSHLNFHDMLYNIIFIVINVLGLIIYFSLKEKSFVNPIDTSIGLGDISFFMAITPLFNLKSFILFFVLGLLFSLTAYGFIFLFKKIKTIPLAGYLALFLILNIVVKSIFKIETLY